MKKILLLCAALLAIGMSANAQFKLKYTIRENNVMETWMGEATYYSNSLTSNIYYLDLGLSTMLWNRLEVGIGLGLGTSNAVTVTANIPLDEDEIRQQAPVFPYFIQLKYHVNPDKTHLFVEGNLGGVLSGANGASGTINPFGMFHGVYIGGEFMFPNSDFRLFVSAGIRTQHSHIDEMKYEYNSILNRYSYSSYKNIQERFPAIVISTGVSF